MFLLFMFFLREKQFHNLMSSDFGFWHPNLKGTILPVGRKPFPELLCIGWIWQFHGRPSVQKFSAFLAHLVLWSHSELPQNAVSLFHFNVKQRKQKLRASLKGLHSANSLCSFIFISIISEIGGANYQLICVEHIIFKLQLLLKVSHINN